MLQQFQAYGRNSPLHLCAIHPVRYASIGAPPTLEYVLAAIWQKLVDAFARRLSRLLAVGTQDYPPKIARRLKILNGMAWLIVVFSVHYAVVFALADFDRYHPFVWLNLALAIMGLAVPFSHRIHELAGGFLIATSEIVALFLFVAMLGRETGTQMNLIVGAAAPFFIFGLHRPVLIAIVVALAFATHVAAWFLFPPEQAWIGADPALVKQLYLSAAAATFGVIAALTWYAFALVQEAEAATEALLRNVLPGKIVDRLTARPGRPIADSHPEITVLFTDLQGFVDISKRLGAQRTVAMLNHLVRAFDAIADRHGVEKIKTIGDSYMAVTGAPESSPEHIQQMVRFAFDIREALEDTASRYRVALRMRIGLASGPVMAGVIGARRFSYDVWGDAVNLAARLEASGEAGKVHVSESVYLRLASENSYARDAFVFEPRGQIDIKGFGAVNTWFLEPAAGKDNTDE